MKNILKKPLKVVSLLLAVSFFISDVGWAAPADMSAVFSSPDNFRKDLLADPTLFQAPLDSSLLKEIKKGSAKTFIIHFQDAHTNLSGQENLANSLDQIMSRYQVRLVLAEGGSQDDSLTPVKSVASPEVWKKVAKKFLIQGKISGEEYLNLTSDHPMKIMGIEDKALYMKSVNAYADLADKREAILDYLKNIKRAADKLKTRLYPRELLDYEKASEGKYEAGNFEETFERLLNFNPDLALFPELQRLAALKENEKAIDFNLANLEQAALVDEIVKAGAGAEMKATLDKVLALRHAKTAQFSYLQNTFNIAKSKGIEISRFPHLLAYREYLEKFNGINLEAVMDQMQRAEDAVYTSALRSTDAATLRSIDRYLNLLFTAYRIQMTTDEFRLFEANEADFTTIAYLSFLNRQLMTAGFFEDILPYENHLEEGKAALHRFYDSVNERDVAFLKNADRILKDEHEEVAVMITGGYHTAHLKNLFNERGYSYAVLAPIVESETDQAKYEKILLEPVRPSGKKIELTDGQSGKSAITVATEKIVEAMNGARLAAMVREAVLLSPNKDEAEMRAAESMLGYATRSRAALSEAAPADDTILDTVRSQTTFRQTPRQLTDGARFAAKNETPDSLTRSVTVLNPRGIHMWPSQKIADIANWVMRDFQVETHFSARGRREDASDVLALTGMGIPQGEAVQVELHRIAGDADLEPIMKMYAAVLGAKDFEGLVLNHTNYMRDYLPDGARLAEISGNQEMNRIISRAIFAHLEDVYFRPDGQDAKKVLVMYSPDQGESLSRELFQAVLDALLVRAKASGRPGAVERISWKFNGGQSAEINVFISADRTNAHLRFFDYRDASVGARLAEEGGRFDLSKLFGWNANPFNFEEREIEKRLDDLDLNVTMLEGQIKDSLNPFAIEDNRRAVLNQYMDLQADMRVYGEKLGLGQGASARFKIFSSEENRKKYESLNARLGEINNRLLAILKSGGDKASGSRLAVREAIQKEIAALQALNEKGKTPNLSQKARKEITRAIALLREADTLADDQPERAHTRVVAAFIRLETVLSGNQFLSAGRLPEKDRDLLRKVLESKIKSHVLSLASLIVTVSIDLGDMLLWDSFLQDSIEHMASDMGKLNRRIERAALSKKSKALESLNVEWKNTEKYLSLYSLEQDNIEEFSQLSDEEQILPITMGLSMQRLIRQLDGRSYNHLAPPVTHVFLPTRTQTRYSTISDVLRLYLNQVMVYPHWVGDLNEWPDAVESYFPNLLRPVRDSLKDFLNNKADSRLKKNLPGGEWALMKKNILDLADLYEKRVQTNEWKISSAKRRLEEIRGIRERMQPGREHLADIDQAEKLLRLLSRHYSERTKNHIVTYLKGALDDIAYYQSEITVPPFQDDYIERIGANLVIAIQNVQSVSGARLADTQTLLYVAAAAAGPALYAAFLIYRSAVVNWNLWRAKYKLNYAAWILKGHGVLKSRPVSVILSHGIIELMRHLDEYDPATINREKRRQLAGFYAEAQALQEIAARRSLEREADGFFYNAKDVRNYLDSATRNLANVLKAFGVDPDSVSGARLAKNGREKTIPGDMVGNLSVRGRAVIFDPNTAEEILYAIPESDLDEAFNKFYSLVAGVKQALGAVSSGPSALSKEDQAKITYLDQKVDFVRRSNSGRKIATNPIALLIRAIKQDIKLLSDGKKLKGRGLNGIKREDLEDIIDFVRAQALVLAEFSRELAHEDGSARSSERFRHHVEVATEELTRAKTIIDRFIRQYQSQMDKADAAAKEITATKERLEKRIAEAEAALPALTQSYERQVISEEELRMKREELQALKRRLDLVKSANTADKNFYSAFVLSLEEIKTSYLDSAATMTSTAHRMISFNRNFASIIYEDMLLAPKPEVLEKLGIKLDSGDELDINKPSQKGLFLVRRRIQKMLEEQSRQRQGIAANQLPAYAMYNAINDIIGLCNGIIADLVSSAEKTAELYRLDIADHEDDFVLVADYPMSVGTFLQIWNKYGPRIRGIIATEATRNSHWVIVAQGLANPPPILITRNKLPAIKPGDEIMVSYEQSEDQGVAYLHPTKAKLKKIVAEQNKQRLVRAMIMKAISKLKDRAELKNFPFRVRANVVPGQLEGLEENDTDGVGLVRTEVLDQVSENLLSEIVERFHGSARPVFDNRLRDNFEETYRSLLEIPSLRGKFVTFRTLDMQWDKDEEFLGKLKELKDVRPNLFDGVTEISGFNFYRTVPGRYILIQQIAALYLARLSLPGNQKKPRLRIMFPQVKDEKDLDFIQREILPKAQAIVEQEMIKRSTGKSSKTPEAIHLSMRRVLEFGVMIETNESLKNIQHILRHPLANFLSVGTNDLTADILSDMEGITVSRDNPAYEEQFSQLNPFVLEELKRLAWAVSNFNTTYNPKNKRTLGFCGEIAGADKFLLFMVYLYNQYGIPMSSSMSVNRIPMSKFLLLEAQKKDISAELQRIFSNPNELYTDKQAADLAYRLLTESDGYRREVLAPLKRSGAGARLAAGDAGDEASRIRLAAGIRDAFGRFEAQLPKVDAEDKIVDGSGVPVIVRLMTDEDVRHLPKAFQKIGYVRTQTADVVRIAAEAQEGNRRVLSGVAIFSADDSGAVKVEFIATRQNPAIAKGPAKGERFAPYYGTGSILMSAMAQTAKEYFSENARIYLRANQVPLLGTADPKKFYDAIQLPPVSAVENEEWREGDRQWIDQTIADAASRFRFKKEDSSQPRGARLATPEERIQQHQDMEIELIEEKIQALDDAKKAIEVNWRDETAALILQEATAWLARGHVPLKRYAREELEKAQSLLAKAALTPDDKSALSGHIESAKIFLASRADDIRSIQVHLQWRMDPMSANEALQSGRYGIFALSQARILLNEIEQNASRMLLFAPSQFELVERTLAPILNKAPDAHRDILSGSLSRIQKAIADFPRNDAEAVKQTARSVRREIDVMEAALSSGARLTSRAQILDSHRNESVFLYFKLLLARQNKNEDDNAFIEWQLEQLSGQSILDLGSGKAAPLANFLIRDLGFNRVYALDRRLDVPEGLEQQFAQSSIQAFGDRWNNRFDKIIAIRVLKNEYLPQPAEVAARLYRMLKTDGELMIFETDGVFLNALSAVFGAPERSDIAGVYYFKKSSGARLAQDAVYGSSKEELVRFLESNGGQDVIDFAWSILHTAFIGAFRNYADEENAVFFAIEAIWGVNARAQAEHLSAVRTKDLAVVRDYEPSRGTPKTYIAMIIHSRILDAGRKRKAVKSKNVQFSQMKPASDSEHVLDFGSKEPSASESAIAAESGRISGIFIHLLEPELFEIYKLRRVDGLSAQQIAELKKINLSKAKRLVATAEVAIRQGMESPNPYTVALEKVFKNIEAEGQLSARQVYLARLILRGDMLDSLARAEKVELNSEEEKDRFNDKMQREVIAPLSAALKKEGAFTGDEQIFWRTFKDLVKRNRQLRNTAARERRLEKREGARLSWETGPASANEANSFREKLKAFDHTQKFNDLYKAPLSVTAVENTAGVRLAQKDEGSLYLFAKAYLAKPAGLFNKNIPFNFSASRLNALVRFREEKEQVFIQFNSEEGRLVGEILIPDALIEKARRDKLLSADEQEAVLKTDVLQKSANIFASVFRQGVKTAGMASVLSGKTVVLSQRLDAATTPDEINFIAGVKKEIQRSFKNIYFNFVRSDKNGQDVPLADLSDSEAIQSLNEGEYRLVWLDPVRSEEIKNRLQSARAANARVLFSEPVNHDDRTKDVLPYAALYIGGVLLGRMDEASEQSRQFLSRLTNVTFTQETYALLLNPDPEKEREYRSILVKPIARIAIDRFLEFTRYALQAIGAAA